MLTGGQLVKDLRALGLRPGDRVIVHASMKAIGPVVDGAREVLKALMEVVTDEGALLLPNLNIPHAFDAAHPPRFDVKRGPLKETIGILPEVFKAEFAQAFSLHPTHALMGWGARAAALLAGHERAGFCCGPGTPWERNAGEGGRILLLGVDQRSNTTYHCAEERMADPYILTPEPVDGVVLLDGQEIPIRSRLHLWRYDTDFNLLNPELASRGLLRQGRIGWAPSMLIEAGGFLMLAEEKLKANRRAFMR